MTHKNDAFTLIEILVVLFILGILVALAYPAYNQHILRAHRKIAEAVLLTAASRLEEYYLANHTYETATLENAGIPAFTENNTYVLSLTNLSENTFLISAFPQENQLKDSCGTLSVNDLGERNAAEKECW